MTGEGERALADLADADTAEAFFEALGVPYDRKTLEVARLHVLRRFGQARDEIDAVSGLSPEERRRRYRVALAEAHDLFTRATPREVGLFGCLREGEGPLVTLSLAAKAASQGDGSLADVSSGRRRSPLAR